MNAGHNDLAPHEVKYAAITATTTSGDNTIVAAVSGKKIRVLNYVVASSGNSTITWESNNTTALSGVINTQAMDQLVAGYNPDGHFQTVAGEALTAALGGNAYHGHLSYIEV